jgi:hypothetical protein
MYGTRFTVIHTGYCLRTNNFRDNEKRLTGHYKFFFFFFLPRIIISVEVQNKTVRYRFTLLNIALPW